MTIDIIGTIAILAVGAVLIAGATLSIKKLSRKRKADKRMREGVNFPNTSNEEIIVLGLCEDIMGVGDTAPPVFIVRDANASIGILEDTTWRDFHGGVTPNGMFYNGVIFINLDSKHQGLFYLGRVHIHELRHFLGEGHEVGEPFEHESINDAELKRKMEENGIPTK